MNKWLTKEEFCKRWPILDSKYERDLDRLISGSIAAGSRNEKKRAISQRERRRQRRKETPEQRTRASWNAMMKRCYLDTDPSFHKYGKRGISVCIRWHQFESFINDMGPRPFGMSIDRINPSGDYEPSNCRWATPGTQASNKAGVELYTHDGVSMTVRGWARRIGIDKSSLSARIKVLGFPRAILEPPRPGVPMNLWNSIDEAKARGMRLCHACSTAKLPSDFYRDRHRTDGLTSSCKSCANKARAALARLP
jgi:hypothetical protein